MDSSLTIRVMTADDIDAVTALYASVLQPDYISFSELAEGKADGPNRLTPQAAAIFQGQLQALWQEGSHGFFVAVQGPTIVGFVLASVHQTEAGHLECWLDDIAVAHEAQHQSVATQLISHVTTWAEERHCAYVLLESGIRNLNAHHLFEQQGFQPLSTVFWRPARPETAA